MRRLAPHYFPHIGPRPVSLRMTGRTNASKETNALTGIARQHDHRDPVIADQSKALRLTRLHGHLGKVTRAHLRHHGFDNVEVALTDSARRQDQIGSQQLIGDQSLERVAIITDLSDSEDLGACSLHGSRQHVGVRVEDLLLVAELEPWINQLGSGGDHHHPRSRSDLPCPARYPRAPRCRGAEVIAHPEELSACLDVLADPADVLTDDAGREDLDVLLATIGVLVGDDGVRIRRTGARS